MEIVRTFEDAFAIGKACLKQINTSKTRPRLLDNYPLPLNIDDGPWEMSENALYQTLSYIMNFLNHSCYMLCVVGEQKTLVKLETKSMSSFFKDILLTDIRKKQDPKISRALLDDKQRLKNMRIMQCVVKPYANESATSVEYEELVQKLNAPDGVYILNLTDAVLLRKNGYIPWKLNRNIKLPTAYQIDRFIPVLSLSGEDGYWDIPIPNYDDVQYVLKSEHPNPNYETAWAKKKNKAVFRGGPTGCGVSEMTNMRIRLAKMGLDPKFSKYLDVGLVSNKTNTIDSDAIRYDPRVGLAYMNTYIQPVAKMPMSEQSKFKYIIHIDGNVHAYRLLTTMRTGSLILRVKSDYVSWIDHLMDQEEKEGNALYVSVKSDLSDLISQIEYCNQHSEKCRLIAERAMNFAETVMTQSYVINAFESVMWKLSEILKPGQSIPLGHTLHDKYAVVSQGRGENEYYVLNETTKKWQADPLIQSIMKMNIKNSEDVLCVLQDMCFASSFNDVSGDENKDETCISEDMVKEKIKTNLLEQFYKQFDNAYFLSKEELDHSIEKKAKYSSEIYKKLEYIKSSKKLADNNARYKIGMSAKVLDIPVSPIQDMVNLILSDTDESRKRRLIITLVDSQKYVYQGVSTEDSTVYVGEKESSWWYYCVQTHVKLIPRFHYILATAVLRNPREYDAIRANLIQEIGKQTDDGIFDKHTGVFIEQIQFVTDEGFEENGFRKQTRDILEQENVEDKDMEDLEMDMEFDEVDNEAGLKDDAALDVFTKEPEIFLTTGNRMLDILNEETFRIQFSPAVIETFDLFMTELTDKLNDAYEQYVLKKPKDMYSKTDYVDIQQTNYLLLIYIYMVELFVSKKKIMQKISTVSNEINPETPTHDLIVPYVAHVLVSNIFKSKKLRKEWPAIYVDKFKKSAVNVVSFMNMKYGDVLKDSMSPKMRQIIEQELSLRYIASTKLTYPQTTWTQFLPPQNPQDLLTIRAQTELQKSVKTTNNTNPTFLFGKMIFLSYCIQRTIQEILNSDKYRDSLVLNVKIYSQMNSCCLENLGEMDMDKSTFGTTLAFFNQNSPNEDLISRYNVLVKKIEAQLLQIRSISRSFMSNIDTKLAYPLISQKLNEEVMNEGIAFLGTLDEIQLLPASSENISQQFLQDYLQFSRLTTHGPPQFAEVKIPLIALLTHIKQTDLKVNDSEIKTIGDILYTFYHPKSGDKDNEDILIQLKLKVSTKLKKLPSDKKKQLERTFNMFNQIFPENINENENDESFTNLDMNSIYSAFAFLRNYIVCVSRVFPMLLINKTLTQELMGTQLIKSKNKHQSMYEFSDIHKTTLQNYIKSQYETIISFINREDDSVVVRKYFEKIQEKTQNIGQLSALTYYTPNKYETDHTYVPKVYFSLFEYYIASIFEMAETIFKEMSLELDDESEETELDRLENAKNLFISFILTYFMKSAKTNIVNRTYKNVMDVVFKHKENEKNRFRKRLEKMSREERLAYQEERKLGIGEYNAKNYAGLKKYDAEFYDKTKQMRDDLQEQEDNFDEKESELMAENEDDEDGEYNNVFEDDGY